MKKVTRVTTAKIIMNEIMTDEDADNVVKSREDAEKNVKRDMERIYKSGNVTVEIKDFVEELNNTGRFEKGDCSRCMFYQQVDVDGRTECTFGSEDTDEWDEKYREDYCWEINDAEVKEKRPWDGLM